MCCDGAKEKYMGTVQILISASRQIREGVASMEEGEEEVVIGESMLKLLDRSKVQVENSMKELLLSAMMASGEGHVKGGQHFYVKESHIGNPLPLLY